MELRPTVRGRPRSEPVEIQRGRVVAAARALFTDRGYAATTVAAVAHEAAVTRAVVYETVGDKQALLGAVATQVSEEVVAGFIARFDVEGRAGASAHELVRSTLDWFLRTVMADPSIGAIVRMAGMLEPAPGQTDAGRARRQIEDGLTALHLRLFGPDQTRSEHAARLIAVAVVAMSERVASRAIDDDWPIDETVDLFTHVVMGAYRVTGSTEGAEAITALNRAASP